MNNDPYIFMERALLPIELHNSLRNVEMLTDTSLIGNICRMPKINASRTENQSLLLTNWIEIAF